MTVEDRSSVSEVLDRLDRLTRSYVKVGIMTKGVKPNLGTRGRTLKALGKGKGGGVKVRTPIKMVDLATIHEFGCDIKVTEKMRWYFLFNFGFKLQKNVIKIPERSFIRSSFDENQDDIGDLGEDLIEQVVNGQLSVKSFYEILGQTGVQMIRRTITDGLSPGLSPMTTSVKGTSKGKPLIDSGGLLKSITYQVIGG